MAVFKCKMCGGALQVEQGAKVITCDYCGVQQTLPKLDDDKRANLYDRANHFRRSNEYDKAMAIYETILSEDSTDAEAYWCIVLCKYGVEYVEDPASHTRIPTCNRTQLVSVFADEDYKQAIDKADGYQREIYEKEARAISEIQKGILEISNYEEPYDIFICYKETDNTGRRTKDSVLAQDLYYQLTGEGFKVFFSRITLEDKLGSAYEPYIFAALQSSKVMVAVGTSAEHFNAVWVKNEWSRYLALIKGGAKKTLIPAYRDMDPYDLPEAFSHLQAQDMSKLGFMQDLIRGIKKIAGGERPRAKEPAAYAPGVTAAAVTGSPDTLLKRAFLFLEDGEFNKAHALLEQVLNIDPENARAYIGQLLAENEFRNEEALKDFTWRYADNPLFKRAVMFADAEYKNKLSRCADFAEENRNNALLQQAIEYSKNAAHLQDAVDILESIRGFKNADELLERTKEDQKDFIMQQAIEYSQDSAHLQDAIEMLKSIRGFKNADELIVRFEKSTQLLSRKKHERRYKSVLICEGAFLAVNILCIFLYVAGDILPDRVLRVLYTVIYGGGFSTLFWAFELFILVIYNIILLVKSIKSRMKIRNYFSVIIRIILSIMLPLTFGFSTFSTHLLAGIILLLMIVNAINSYKKNIHIY